MNVLASEISLALADPAAARQQAETALADARGTFGDFKHAQPTGQALMALGRVAAAQGDTTAARRHLQDAAAQFEGAVGAESAFSAEARRRLAALP